ncbi:Heterokaryon incompatibility protein (HET) domain containing protein [Naviculisporaceae sp. PSN 640]
MLASIHWVSIIYATAGRVELYYRGVSLVISSPSADSASPIICDLFPVGDKKRLPSPRFDALSNVWGDLNDTVPITVNGFLFRITRNLDAALHRLRKQNDTLTLWVDAICINQADLVERSQQVKRMGQIYRQARHVYMWVGEVTADFPALLGLLEAFLNPMDFIWKVSRAFANDEEGCIALTKLLARPYWRPAALPHIWLPIQGRHPWILPLRRALFNIMHLFMPPGEASSIHNTLQPTRHLQASDPRDKLYAPIGARSRHPQDLSRLGLRTDMSVDYSKPVRDVYTDFTRRVIAADGNLSVLLTSGMWNPEHGPSLDIPSWVPDMRGSSGVDVRFLAAYHLKHFNASDGKTYIPTKCISKAATSDQFTLEVKALLVDKVENVISDTSRADFLSGATAAIRKENLAWMKRLLFGFCRDVEDAQNHNKTSHDDWQVQHGLESRNLETCMSIPGPNGDASLSLEEEYARLKQSGSVQELEAYRTEYLYRTGRKSANETPCNVFIGEKWHIGMGPCDCKPGDVLAVLVGCPTPVVLRAFRGHPSTSERSGGKEYQLSGPCYLYGMMNGEVFEKYDQREIADICLM